MSGDALSLFPELFQREAEPRNTGLLPSQRLEELISAGYITSDSPISADQIQPSSLDLRLGAIAYRVRASFLPTRFTTVSKKLQEVATSEIDLSRSALLEKRTVYIVPLQEELRLPESLSGMANPKSSTGRLDIFIRLITDYGIAFEEVPAGYKGKLYAEIVPLTFTIVVREGMKLNQLRLRRGGPAPSDTMLRRMNEREPLVYSQDALPAEALISEGLRLSVDLKGTNDSDIVGFRAKKNTAPIDLAKVGYYEPKEFWEPLYRNMQSSLILDPGEFYILTSKQKVRIPPDSAAEMVPYDPSVGEFRIHYAGFFDPGFGWGSAEPKGTHAVLEVRSHEVPSLLEDGQVVCRLVYESLMAAPAKLYGQGIGSSYQSQRLALSKHFRPW